MEMWAPLIDLKKKISLARDTEKSTNQSSS